MGKSLQSGIVSSPSPRIGRVRDRVSTAIKTLNGHPVAVLLAQVFPESGALFHVGGSVRDALLMEADSGLQLHDLDFTTPFSPATILERLQGAGIRALEMSAKHGTIIAVIDGESYEITQFRDATRTLDGDLALRDFTINALAVSVHRNEEEVIDPLGGVADLEQGVVRFCGEAAARIAEDPHRLLRAVRFGPARGLKLDDSAAQAITTHAALINRVAPERIREELEKILLSADSRAGFQALLDLGLLAHVLPEVLPSVGSEQNEWHTEDVFGHTLTVIERADATRMQRWCALFHDLGKPATASVGDDGRRHFYGHEKVSEQIALAVMERLKFSTDDQRQIALLVRQHMRPINVGESGVRRILRDLGELYGEWRRFKVADSPPIVDDTVVGQELAAFDVKVQTELDRPKGSVFGALAVDGNDLKTIGVPQGVKIGQILRELHEAVLDDPNLNDRETLLMLARQKAAIL